ncbi:MAG TPA: Wzy polymerase domain-containing protein, partial [Steroidobacteraceae bacterium]|nr:Wzy polymerase domain-containing protein [Steroidobacteraceae bacterium]
FRMAILDHSGRPNVLRAVVLLIGLAWTIPFLQPYHRFPLTAFYSEWLAFALGLAAAAWLLTREPWREATVPLIALAPLALAALLAVQVALDRVPYAEQALTAGLYLMWAALMALLGHALGRRLPLDAIATTLAWFLLAAGVLQVLIGLVQHYNVSTPFNFMITQRGEQGVYGNLAQINQYGASIALSLISVTYLCSRGSLVTAAAAACAALLLVALALAGSRSAWLYLAMLFVLALVVHRRLRNNASRRIAVFACMFPLGFVAALWLVKLPMLLPTGGPPMMGPGERVFQIASGVGPRLELWGEAWQLFLTAPVLGAGLGQFAWHHFLHNDPASGATGSVFSHAHNVVLQLMAETGVAGALIIVGAMLAWLVGLRRVRLDPAWWWLLSALAVIGIHSLLEYPLWYSYFLGPAALLLGLGAQQALPMRFPGAARAAVALSMLVGCVNLAAVILAYRDFERLVFSTEQHASPAPSDQAFADALTKVHDEPLLRPYVELAMAYAVSVDRVQLDEKLALVTRAMRFAPVHVVVFRQAQLLALAGRAEAAREQLERSLRAYPYELKTAVAELTTLARLYPSEMGPLLELAASKSAEGRVSR